MSTRTFNRFIRLLSPLLISLFIIIFLLSIFIRHPNSVSSTYAGVFWELLEHKWYISSSVEHSQKLHVLPNVPPPFCVSRSGCHSIKKKKNRPFAIAEPGFANFPNLKNLLHNFRKFERRKKKFEGCIRGCSLGVLLILDHFCQLENLLWLRSNFTVQHNVLDVWGHRRTSFCSAIDVTVFPEVRIRMWEIKYGAGTFNERLNNSNWQ